MEDQHEQILEVLRGHVQEETDEEQPQSHVVQNTLQQSPGSLDLISTYSMGYPQLWRQCVPCPCRVPVQSRLTVDISLACPGRSHTVSGTGLWLLFTQHRIFPIRN